MASERDNRVKLSVDQSTERKNDDKNDANSGSSMFSGLFSWFDQLDEFNDQQRMERLQRCRQLEKSLLICRERQRAIVESDGTATQSDGDEGGGRLHDEIESTTAGLRMMKYFGWRGLINAAPYAIPEDEQDAIQMKSRDTLAYKQDKAQQLNSTCAREQHALWGCRAVAVGCGDGLSRLKKCFDKAGAENVLTCPLNTYESSNNGNGTQSPIMASIPCAELQRSLGYCVTKGAHDLYKREQQRHTKS